MKVYGHEIKEEQIETIFNTIKDLNSTFRLHNVEIIIASSILKGASVAAQNRCADRLLQRWRKEGKIRFVFDYWVVVK